MRDEVRHELVLALAEVLLERAPREAEAVRDGGRRRRARRVVVAVLRGDEARLDLPVREARNEDGDGDALPFEEGLGAERALAEDSASRPFSRRLWHSFQERSSWNLTTLPCS